MKFYHWEACSFWKGNGEGVDLGEVCLCGEELGEEEGGETVDSL
jgi:hypothetical protein